MLVKLLQMLVILSTSPQSCTNTEIWISYPSSLHTRASDVHPLNGTNIFWLRYMFLRNMVHKSTVPYYILEINCRYCQPSEASPIKFTSFSRTMHRLIVHFKKWSCFTRPPNSPILTRTANRSDLNPVHYRIWAVVQERVYQTPIHSRG